MRGNPTKLKKKKKTIQKSTRSVTHVQYKYITSEVESSGTGLYKVNSF